MSEQEILQDAEPGAARGSEAEDENIGNKIVSGGVWRLVAFGISTGLGVVSTAIISREVGPAEFALLTTAFSLIAIASSFSDFGLATLGVREFAALSGPERERSQRALITVRLVFSFLASVAIVGFAIASDYPEELVVGLVAAGIGLCGLSMHASFNVPIQATYRLNTLAGLEVSRQTLIAVGMASAALITGEIGVIVGVYLPVGIVMAIASAYFARRITPIAPSLDWEEMVSLLRHVGVFAIAASVGAVYAYVAQVICNSILPPHESGMFGLAFRVYAVLIGACMVAISGAFALLVTSSRDDRDRLAYATHRLIQTAVLTGTACSVGLVTGASFVVAVLGGPEFRDADPIVAIIGLALPASFVLFTGSIVLLAAGKHGQLVLVSVLGATASIGVTTFLTHEYGMTGAASGIVIGEAVIATGYLIQISRLDTRALPGFGWTIAVFGAGAVACAPALLSLNGFVAAVFGLAIFGALGTLLKLFPPELLDRVKAFIPGRG